MPTVPALKGPSVNQAGMPGVRVSTDAPAEAFGGGQSYDRLYQAAGNLLNTGHRIAVEEKRRADDLATIAASTELEKSVQDLTYNTKDGLLTRKGKNAFGAQEEFNERLKKRSDEIEQGLKNEDQKDIFRRIRLKTQANFNGQIERHTFAEKTEYDKQETEAGVQTQIGSAVLNFKDQAKINDSIGMIATLVNSHAERNGLPDEQRKLMLEASVSKTHAEVINRMLKNGDDLDAKRHFDQARAAGQISGNDVAKIESSLEEGSLRGESQRQAAAITAKYGSMAEAVAAARKIEDPKIQDATVDRVKDYFATKKAADNERVERLHKYATDIIDKTGSIDEIPPNQWKQFSLSERSALKSYAKHKKEGTEPTTDWGRFYDLKTMAAEPSTQNEFAKTNLMAFRSIMADAEFKQLIDLQTGLRNKDDKAKTELNDFRSEEEIVKGVISSFGLDPTPKPGDNANKVNMIRNLIGERQSALQAQLKRKLTPDEMKKLADEVMLEKVKVKGWLWGENEKPISDLEIDADDRRMIVNELKRAGKPASEHNILKLYLLKNKAK